MSEIKIAAADVKRLRDATGAGMMDAKKALIEAEGDFEKAADIVRKNTGRKMADRVGERHAGDGLVHAYLHAPTPGIPAKIGVLLALQCETDFVAKGDAFQALANDLALHIAAINPMAISEADIDPAAIQKERDFAIAEATEQGKPANIIEKIAEGRVNAMLKESCLLNQPFFRNPDITVAQRIEEVQNTTKEKIEVTRFVRYEI